MIVTTIIIIRFLPDILNANGFVAVCIIVRCFQGFGAGVSETVAYGFVATIFKDSAATVIVSKIYECIFS